MRQYIVQEVEKCQNCNGTGKKGSGDCYCCSGAGYFFKKMIDLETALKELGVIK